MKKPSFFPWSQIFFINLNCDCLHLEEICHHAELAPLTKQRFLISSWIVVVNFAEVVPFEKTMSQNRREWDQIKRKKSCPKLISKFVYSFLIRSCSLGFTAGHSIVWHFVFAWWIYLQGGSSASWRCPILLGRPRIVHWVLERRGGALWWEQRRQLRGEGEIAAGTSYYAPIIWKQLQIRWICVSSENYCALKLVFDWSFNWIVILAATLKIYTQAERWLRSYCFPCN